jgi:hypothetical protein
MPGRYNGVTVRDGVDCTASVTDGTCELPRPWARIRVEGEKVKPC